MKSEKQNYLREDPDGEPFAGSAFQKALKGLLRKCRVGALRGKTKSYDSEEELLQVYNSPEVQQLPVEERLPAVFKVPNSIRQYEAESPIWTLLHFRGTALQLCLLRPDFWALFAFHVVIAAVYFGVSNHEAFESTSVKGVPTAKNWPKASQTLVAIPGSLITFALVFYVSQTYQRWFTQYGHVKGAGSKLGELVISFRTQFRDTFFEEAGKVRRHLANLLNAAHILGYAGLPQNRAAGIHIWAFDFCVEKKLLTPAQAERIKELMLASDGRLGFKELLLWVSSGIWTQVEREHLDPRCAFYMHRVVFDFRDHMDAAYNFTTGPIPFAYYHHLNLITLIYLFLLGYVFVFSAPWMSIPGYFLILAGFISMREIGNIMSDPLGDDDSDLPVFELALGGVRVFTKLVDLPPNDDLVPPFPDGDMLKAESLADHFA